MPCLKILTNVPKSKIPSDFVNRVIPILAAAVKKPDEKFLCVISGDCQLGFAGESTIPGVVATLESIGNLGPKENQSISKQLSVFMEKELGVPPNRFFVTFYDLKSYEVGIAGTTAQVIEG